jgi:ssDNA-specific exonuclease RecJ
MAQFVEKYGSIYCVDEDGGSPLYEVSEPAILFCTNMLVRIQLGNREDIDNYFKKQVQKHLLKGSDMTDTWVLMDLPRDLELLNRLLNNSTYLEVYLKNIGFPLNIE